MFNNVGSIPTKHIFMLIFLIFSSINGIFNLGPNLLWISTQLSSNLTSINLLWIWIPALIFFLFSLILFFFKLQ